MAGYIGVTARKWFTYLSSSNGINEVNFWRKNTDNFNVLKQGEPFFFLVKNEKGVRGERAVLGTAAYERFEKLTVNEAWDRYRNGNGDEEKDEFITRMNEMFETDKCKGEIGCIILSDFKVFDNPVYLSEVGVDFKNSIVSGKSLKDAEVNNITEFGFIKQRETVKRLAEAEIIGFSEDDEGFPEGKLVLKQHLIRERNLEVIKLAKERFLQLHGRYYCEVCEFDFAEHYGEVGEGYIEGHHTKPVSEMGETELTMVEDIALVCSNCHRMLHRKRPWLSIDELKQVLTVKKVGEPSGY
ncbi:HNH endonuclease [Mesobacillus subterraneus]|uniref:HNH endonuclease n=1 Tax=Mesobacillus subterraneus TaxID=285983 RepID=UPI00203E5974|nr:HNH endonuclease [Mesobacillus subterraneus]MCM3572507.1 HNH endonuclease [Mesobacillus subterraneus]